MSDAGGKVGTSPTALTQNPAAVHIGHAGAVLRDPFDMAVVIPTILRPSLVQAVLSIFAQDFKGRIHILIGVDQSDAARSLLNQAVEGQPAHCVVTVLDPGYSTSQRHGGMHPAYDGGALRTVLSYLANSRYVAYLDDDNWWDPSHLSTLRAAIDGQNWAFALRRYVDPETGSPHCIDRWESVGPGRGVYNTHCGGFVDPNCLMIDKIACEPVLRLWAHPLADLPTPEPDRSVFHQLSKDYRWGETGQATVRYRIRPEDVAHGHRRDWIYEETGTQIA